MKAYPAKSRFMRHRRCGPLPCPLPAVIFLQHDIMLDNHGMLENGEEHEESVEAQVQAVIESLTNASLSNLTDYEQHDIVMRDDGQYSVSASLQSPRSNRTSFMELSTTTPRSPSASTASSTCRSIGSSSPRSRSWSGCDNHSRHYGQLANDFCWKAAGRSQLEFQIPKSPPTSVAVHAIASECYGGQQNVKTTTMATTTTTTTATSSSPIPIPKPREQPWFQMTTSVQALETTSPPQEQSSGGQQHANTEMSNNKQHRNDGGDFTATGTTTARNAELLGGKLANVRRRMYGKIKLRGTGTGVARPTAGGGGGGGVGGAMK